MKFLEDWIAYFVASVLIFFFERIPPAAGLRIGDFFGKLIFYFSKKRRIAYINLKAAFGDKYSEKERWKIIWNHYGHVGKCVVEVMSFRKLTRERIEKNLHIHSIERFHNLCKQNKGGILLAAHYGNWELLQVVAGIIEKPIHAMGQDQKHPKLNTLLNSLRESHGSVAISRGVKVRYLIKALKEKKMVGFLGDTPAGRAHGLIIPFLGRKTTFPTGACELSFRTGAPILPCYIIRRDGMEHDIYIEEPLKDDPGKEKEDRIRSLLGQYVEILEKFLERAPDQWLWENKRWKYSWTRRILILSDGKKGHEKQSKAVACLFNEIKKYHGRPGLEFEHKTIFVEYKSKFRKKIFFAIVFLLKPWIQGRLNWLSWAFSKKTVLEMQKTSADFIIVTGSGLIPLQYCLAKDMGAKKIIIMKPPFPYNRMSYDLAIVPAHDEGKIPKKTFRTFIMPSGFKSKDLTKDVSKLRARFSEDEQPRVAVFLGGVAHGCDFTVSDVEKLLNILKRSTDGYMLTTSRRTSQAVERFLKVSFSHDDKCRLFVNGREDDSSYVVPGMMALADILIVTEDSLAMISEAVGSEKKVIVLKFSEKSLPEKHKRFHKILSKRNLVMISRLKNLDKAFHAISALKISSAITKEKEILLKEMESLL